MCDKRMFDYDGDLRGMMVERCEGWYFECLLKDVAKALARRTIKEENGRRTRERRQMTQKEGEAKLGNQCLVLVVVHISSMRMAEWL